MATGLKMGWTLRVAGLSFAGLLLAAQAKAQTNLVTNGGFETTTMTASGEIGGAGDRGGLSQNVTGWSSAGLAFLFFPNASAVSGTSADTTGASQASNFGYQAYLWGPGNKNSTSPGNGQTPTEGSAGGTAASGGTEGGTTGNTTLLPGVANGLTNSPNGNNFVAMDGDSTISGPLTQTVAGLGVGGVYKLTFYWAAAEQEGASYEAATTEQFKVSLGGSTVSTSVINNVAEGFSGWQTATMYFEASSASQVLSFLAVGTPNGVPPFALLDGVSLVLAPEPTSWAVMMVGLIGMGFMVWCRRSAVAGSDSVTS